MVCVVEFLGGVVFCLGKTRDTCLTVFARNLPFGKKGLGTTEKDSVEVESVFCCSAELLRHRQLEATGWLASPDLCSACNMAPEAPASGFTS